jgi:hypothetical protein
MSDTYNWIDPETLERREISVPQDREQALALVAHVSEPTRSKLIAAYDEGWYLGQTRLYALWYMAEMVTTLRWGI